MKQDDFHKHLDDCCQCREQPFNLCDFGKHLAQEVILELQMLAVRNSGAYKRYRTGKPQHVESEAG